jgi:hypothetical protein
MTSICRFFGCFGIFFPAPMIVLWGFLRVAGGIVPDSPNPGIDGT